MRQLLQRFRARRQMPPAQIVPRRQLRQWLVKFGCVKPEARLGRLLLQHKKPACTGDDLLGSEIETNKGDIRFECAVKHRISLKWRGWWGRQIRVVRGELSLTI